MKSAEEVPEGQENTGDASEVWTRYPHREAPVHAYLGTRGMGSECSWYVIQ